MALGAQVVAVSTSSVCFFRVAVINLPRLVPGKADTASSVLYKIRVQLCISADEASHHGGDELPWAQQCRGSVDDGP